MKIRRNRSPLLLLLLPSLTVVLASAVPAKSLSLDKTTETRDTLQPGLGDLASTISKSEVGTKDAPVDGKDGKPHAGPFVDTPERKKTPAAEPGVEAELIPMKTAMKESQLDLAASDGGKIPETNDGVMNDQTREKPKVGTTGTEGGVSEKDKARKAQEGQTGEKLEKIPDSPKEVPPLPASEKDKTKEVVKVDKDGKQIKEKIKDIDADIDDTSEISGLEKPDNLPDAPHSIPHPVPESANKAHLHLDTDPAASKSTLPDLGEEEGLIQPMHSYLLSLAMILFSEIGDKTFLIAALMAMKHDRLLVFSAALSALITMTVLSAVLGHTVPTLLPKRFTNFAAAILFLVFGAKMLKEGLAMSPTEGVAAEMQEVELELEEKEHQARQQGRRRSSMSPYALEMGLSGHRSSSHNMRKSRSGSRLPSPPRSPSSSPDRDSSPQRSSLKGALNGFSNLLSLLLSPAWVQTFVMTFLGEWGDRSQIATIAMAAGQDYWWVTGGAVSGHAVCTGVAVLGGRAIAGRVSMRVVTLGGAIAFLIFGVIYLVEAVYYA